MKKPASHNKRVGVLLMAFRARKGFGTFEKRAPVSCKYFVRVCRGLSTSTWKLGEATSVCKWCLCYVCRHLQLSRYDGPQGTCCKQKTIAANKKDALQTKNDCCKQKTCAANKKRSLQTKKMRCKQKTIAANKKHALQTKNDRSKQKTIAANKKWSLQTKKMRCKQKTLSLIHISEPTRRTPI